MFTDSGAVYNKDNQKNLQGQFVNKDPSYQPTPLIKNSGTKTNDYCYPSEKKKWTLFNLDTYFSKADALFKWVFFLNWHSVFISSLDNNTIKIIINNQRTTDNKFSHTSDL